MSSTVTKTEDGMSVTGQLVFTSVTGLLEQGNQLIQQNLSTNDTKVFVIDCKKMQRIDSAGIALLLEWQRQFNKSKLSCRFAALSDQAESLIQAYRLQSLIA